MPESPKIAQFPTSRRERSRLLRRSQDVRLRIAALTQAISGWLFLVLTVVFIFTHYTLFTPTNLRNISNYLRMGLSSGSVNLTTINFPSGSASVAASFSTGLAFADSDTLYVASPGGATQMSVQLTYADLNLCTSKSRVLAYDRGGNGYTLTDGTTVLKQSTLKSPILSASMSRSGSFAVVTDEQGYKSAITVFDPSGAQTYKWYSSEYYVQSAALSPSGKLLGALVFRANGLSPEGKLLLFTVGQDTAPQEISLKSALGLSADFLSEKAIATVCDTGAYVFDTAGKQLAAQTYTTDEPIAFAVTDGMLAVALRSYHAGARAEILLLSDSGKTTGPLYIAEELQSLSLAQDRIAVLTSSDLHIYNNELQPLWSNRTAVGARCVLMQDNDLVYAVFSKNAHLLTPTRSEETP